MRSRIATTLCLLVQPAFSAELYSCKDEVTAGITFDAGEKKVVNLPNPISFDLEIEGKSIKFINKMADKPIVQTKFKCFITNGDNFKLYRCSNYDDMLVFNDKELRFNRGLLHITFPVRWQTPIRMSTGTCTKS